MYKDINPLAFFFLLASMILTAGGCRKETPIFPVNEDFLSYCYFEKGSYWIYKNDSLHSIVDSVYVLGNSKFVQYVPGRPETAYDNYGYVYMVRGRRTQVDIFSAGLNGKRPTMLEDDGLVVQLFSGFPGDSILDGSTKIVGRFDTLRVNDVVYNNVIELSHRIPVYNNPTKEITFAKGVGVIHRKFWDGTSWGLVRYHLN